MDSDSTTVNLSLIIGLAMIKLLRLRAFKLFESMIDHDLWVLSDAKERSQVLIEVIYPVLS